MVDSKKYLNPPLVEAVFELSYRSPEWSPIIPGLFYTEIKDRFPNITANQNGFGITLDPMGLKIGGGPSELTQYKSEDNHTLVQLSNNLLTINKLPEYLSWQSYKETIEYTISAFMRVYKKIEINRIGLRFINKIDVGDSHSFSNLKKYFDIYPNTPSNLQKEINSIQLSFESPLIKDTEILALSLVTLRKEPKYNSPVLLQLYMTRIKDMAGIQIGDWIEKAHEELRETFENSITKQCKKEFDNVRV